MKIYVVGASANRFLPLDDIREKYLTDIKHEGDNIDFLNPWYCELTGMYYLWKHCSDDIIGLEHYRRYFVNSSGALLSETEIQQILQCNDVICRKRVIPTHQKTLWNALSSEHQVYLLKFLSFLPKAEANFIHQRIHNNVFFEQCNMMIGKYSVLDEYMRWFLTYASEYTMDDLYNHRRIVGYMSEFVFGGWLAFNHYKVDYELVKTYDSNVSSVIELF